MNPQWNRTFYFDIEDLYHNLVLSIYDQDLSGKDDFLGRICLPLQNIQDGRLTEYRLKTKNCDSYFEKGSVSLTCVRHVNYVRGNYQILYPMSEDYMPFETNYTISTLFDNLGRLKAFQPKNLERWIEYASEVFAWTFPITTIVWLVVYIIFILYFELWWLPLIFIIILVIGKTEPQFFLLERRFSKSGRSESVSNIDDEEKKTSYIQESQIYIEAICGILEKIYHIYRWIQPQISLTIVICLALSKLMYCSNGRNI